MKKIFKYILSTIFYSIAAGIVIGLLYPVFDGVSLELYKAAGYWISCVIIGFVVKNIDFYFTKLNPRTFYHCADIILASVILTLTFFASILVIVLIGLMEDLIIKILLIISVVIFILFIVYVVCHRGVAIYNKGKIRIFKFKIKTYYTKQIDNIEFEYNGKKCTINIIVEGQNNIFKLPSNSAKVCEKRFKTLMCDDIARS